MGSSGSGSGNPMFLSQGGQPIPGLPIAGQGAPNDDPRNFGKFQSFLPDLPAAGGGAAPLARGLTSDMLQYRSPGGAAAPAAAAAAAPAADAQRQQLAAIQSSNGQFGAAGDGTPPHGPVPIGWTTGAQPIFDPGGATTSQPISMGQIRGLMGR
jgi:hypothetical protein